MTKAEEVAAGAGPADAAAFVALLDPILPLGYRLAFGMLRSEADAEDAVQDAALSAWRGFHRFRRDAELRPWFLTIVANRCRSLRRAPWYRVLKLPTLPSAGSLPGEDAEGIDLRRALDALPHGERLLIVLRFYLDLSYDQVGAVIGTSAKAAKSRTHRALARLRLAPEVSSS